MSELTNELYNHLLTLVNPQNDGNQIKTSEQYLKGFIQHSQSVSLLFEIFLKSELPEMRQLTCVLLGTLVTLHWVSLPPEFKVYIKNNIYPILAKEENRLVIAAIRNLLVTLMKSTIMASESWPDFMANLFGISQSPNILHQEVVLGVFESLLSINEFVNEYRSVFGNLMQLIFSALGEQSPVAIKIPAIKVLAALLSVLDGEEQVSHFRPLLPVIMNTIGTCIEQHQDNEAIEALCCFDDIIESVFCFIQSNCDLSEKSAFLFLKPELLNFINFILQIGKSAAVSSSVRQQALTTIAWLAQYKPKNVLAHDVILPFLQVVFQLLCEVLEDEDEEDEEDTIRGFGAYLLNVLATHLSPTKILEESMTFIDNLCKSPNPLERRAAISALCVLSSGSHFVMQEDLGEYIPYLYIALEDTELIVRRVACLSAGQMADNLQPDISEFSREILPRLLVALNESDKNIQENTCSAIVSFVQKLEDESILPFMEGALNRLMDLLKNSNSKEIQEMAITGISAVVLAAEEHIEPFYHTLMEAMIQLVQITDFSLVRLRGCALECAGVLALAMGDSGRQMFAPFLTTFMDSAFTGLKEENFAFELRDYTFGFFARMAELAEKDFAIFLPDVVQNIIESFESQSGFFANKSLVGTLLQDKFSDDPTVTTDDNFKMSTGFIEGKVVSLNALTILSYTTKEEFVPYVKTLMPYVTFYLKYYERKIRVAAVKPAEAMLITIAKSFPPPNGAYVKGVPAEHQPISAETKQMLDLIMPRHIATITNDKEVSVATTVLDSIRQIAKQLGPGAIEPYMPAIGDAIGAVLDGQTVCQQIFDDSDEDAISVSEEEDDTTRKLFALYQNACEVTTRLSMIFQDRWDYYYPLVHLIQKNLLSSSEDNLRQEAIGTMAEIIEHLEVKISPHLDELMRIGIKYLGDAYLPCASNAAFMCGKLCEYCPAQSLQYYQELCEHGARLLSQKAMKKYGDASDNAVAMLCRMIMANFEQVPLDRMLPAIIMNLPVKADQEESVVIYPFLSQLVLGKHPSVAQYIPNIVHLFAYLLDAGNEELDELSEEKKEIVMDHVTKTIKFLIIEFPDQMGQILATLQPQQCEKIQQILTQ